MTLQVTLPNDREIAFTRSFTAPRRMVWDAHTRPELVKRWLLGPPGWTMPICEIDLRVGGKYRYVWQKGEATTMGMGGRYLEVVVPERLSCTEQFDDAWYEGEAVGTLVLTEDAGKTTLHQSMRYASKAVRDAVLKSGMERGIAASFDNLDALLQST
jgi:uncharacterized protein YndB with AHSA1/START domain